MKSKRKNRQTYTKFAIFALTIVVISTSFSVNLFAFAKESATTIPNPEKILIADQHDTSNEEVDLDKTVVVDDKNFSVNNTAENGIVLDSETIFANLHDNIILGYVEADDGYILDSVVVITNGISKVVYKAKEDYTETVVTKSKENKDLSQDESGDLDLIEVIGIEGEDVPLPKEIENDGEKYRYTISDLQWDTEVHYKFVENRGYAQDEIMKEDTYNIKDSMGEQKIEVKDEKDAITEVLDKSPQTNDDYQMNLWFGILVISLISAIAIYNRKRIYE